MGDVQNPKFSKPLAKVVKKMSNIRSQLGQDLQLLFLREPPFPDNSPF